MSKFVRSVLLGFVIAAICSCFVGTGWFLYVTTFVVYLAVMLGWSLIKLVFRLLIKAGDRADRGMEAARSQLEE